VLVAAGRSAKWVGSRSVSTATPSKLLFTYNIKHVAGLHPGLRFGADSHPTFSFPAAAGLTSGWQSASFTSYDPQNTRFSGIYAITGASADIPIAFGLQIIAANNVTLDYSHTGSISIGHVDGVSYTSDSGVFLTAGSGVGGVPEPGTWALLVAGFAAVGTVARRRRKAANA